MHYLLAVIVKLEIQALYAQPKLAGGLKDATVVEG